MLGVGSSLRLGCEPLRPNLTNHCDVPRGNSDVLVVWDTFNRLLVAQALVEPMRLIIHDTTVARYNDTIICVECR